LAIFLSIFNVLGGKMEEYFGWIFIAEKLPLDGERVLIAYIDDGEVEILISSYREQKFCGNISLGMRWSLPQYYSQKKVVAWRQIPPFTM
jgi:hypothetical protein